MQGENMSLIVHAQNDEIIFPNGDPLEIQNKSKTECNRLSLSL